MCLKAGLLVSDKPKERPSVSRNCAIYSSFDVDEVIVRESHIHEEFHHNLGGVSDCVFNKRAHSLFMAGKMMRFFILFLVQVKVSFTNSVEPATKMDRVQHVERSLFH